MLRRISALLLCALLCISALLLVSCNKDSGEGGNSGIKEFGSASDKGFLNEQIDWQGETITVLGYNGEFSYHSIQIATEEQTGEALNDAFYERNAKIEELFNLKIKVELPGTGEDTGVMIKNAVLGNSADYDAVVAPLYILGLYLPEDIFLDFNSIENDYLHLDEAWWDQELQKQVAVNGSVYFIAGDALIEDDEATWAMFFNKDMYNSNANLAERGSIYDIVKNGDWTLDVMYEMINDVEYSTGEQKVWHPDSEDKWGMVTQMLDFYLFMQGCGQTMIDNTGDVPELRGGTEENINTFYDVAAVLLDEENVGCAELHVSWNDGHPYQMKRQIFGNGNALFMPNQLAVIGQSEISEAEINYGLIPMPKKNENQDHYTSGVEVYHYSAIALPATAQGKKLEATCYALEAMAYYGNQIVNDDYYERTLTYRRFKDDESGDMLELILNNKTYDMGAIFNFKGGEGMHGTLGFYTDLYGEKSTDIVSHWESVVNSYQTGIDKFVEQCNS